MVCLVLCMYWNCKGFGSTLFVYSILLYSFLSQEKLMSELVLTGPEVLLSFLSVLFKSHIAKGSLGTHMELKEEDAPFFHILGCFIRMFSKIGTFAHTDVGIRKV